MGSRERYEYAVRPSARVSVPVRAPFATPSRPSGTVTRKVKSALSEGWSLHGKTVCAEFGCGQIAKPSGVTTQAVCARARAGSAPYSTRTVTHAFAGSGRAGV